MEDGSMSVWISSETDVVEFSTSTSFWTSSFLFESKRETIKRTHTICNRLRNVFQYYEVMVTFTLSPAFLQSSTYIRRKYWIRENFRHPVFDRFACFEMSLHVHA